MKHQRVWTNLLAGFLSLVLVISALGNMAVHAERSSGEIRQEISKLEDKKSEIDRQIAELEGQIADNMGEMEVIIAQKNIIDQEVFLLHQQVDTINAQIAAYNALIADKQEELLQAQTLLAELNAQNKERIRAMEEDGKLSYWSVIFQASSFSDLLDRLNMIQEIAAADRRRMKALSEAADAVEKATAELEGQKAELETSKEELAETEKSLNDKRAQADALLGQLLAKGEEYQTYLDEMEEKANEAMKELDELETAYDAAKDREYQQWLAQQPKPNPPANNNTSTGNTGGTGGTSNDVEGITWLVPINYTYFSSPFGYRYTPTSHIWKMHYGVDLLAPTGTPIIASRSGKVTTTAYEADGAGYYVNINHGDGFMTRYMHMTHYIVSPGEYVAAGQVIGYSGNTGNSSAPHLHFSVYLNGTPVNPALYINI